MCIRTVEGEDGMLRTVDGEPGSERTVDGGDFNGRNVSGLSATGSSISLLGTTPTVTELTTGSGTYTTPIGCIYIEVYAIGRGASGRAGIVTSLREHGGGGGAGGIAIGFFLAGSYTWTLTGLLSSFSNISGATGVTGDSAVNTSTTYSGGTPGTTTNSVYNLGYITAMPPGYVGANGGCSFYAGQVGLGPQSNSLLVDGDGGFIGGGGGGGTNLGTGGSESTGRIRIIEYY